MEDLSKYVALLHIILAASLKPLVAKFMLFINGRLMDMNAGDDDSGQPEDNIESAGKLINSMLLFVKETAFMMQEIFMFCLKLCT